MDQQELWQRYKQIAFKDFDKSGEWPSIQRVHITMIRRFSNEPVTLNQLQNLYTRSTGSTTFDAYTPASLHVSELQDLAEARWLVNEFLQVVIMCARKQLESDEDRPKISSVEIMDRRNLDGATIRRLHTLLQTEMLILASGGSNAERTEWSYEIGSDAHLYRDVQTISDYLEVRDRLLGRVTIPSEELPQEPRAEKQIGFKRPG